MNGPKVSTPSFARGVTQRSLSAQKNQFIFLASEQTGKERVKKKRKHAEKCLAQKLVLSPYRGFISFPFRCCRHLRFPMTSTNFTLFFWFPLGCSSLYAFLPKSAFWQFFLLTHPSVSSVFVFRYLSIFSFVWPTHTFISNS